MNSFIDNVATYGILYPAVIGMSVVIWGTILIGTIRFIKNVLNKE